MECHTQDIAIVVYWTFLLRLLAEFAFLLFVFVQYRYCVLFTTLFFQWFLEYFKA